MKKPTYNSGIMLYDADGTAMCSSRQVAELFEKEHNHVMRDIRELDCSEEFRLSNFGQIFEKDSYGRKQPVFYMTRDGFTFLAMGYRGRKAAKFKEAYIKRFNEMEQYLRVCYPTRERYAQLCAAVEAAHDEPKHYHYSNENNLIYLTILGMTAKKFRESRGLPEGENVRLHMTPFQLSAVDALQSLDAGLLIAGMSYDDRKKTLSDYYAQSLAIHEKKHASSVCV